MTDILEEKERADFEKAYAERFPFGSARFKFKRDELGDYEDGRTFAAWEMWKIARRSQPEGWISVEDRLPPACANVFAWKAQWNGRRREYGAVVCYISCFPRECVEEDEITHWMPLPAPPIAAAPGNGREG